MKFKSLTMIFNILLFLFGIVEFLVLLMKFKLPTAIELILPILLFICSISEFIKTRKIRKLAYPSIVIWFLVVLPIIENLICNKILYLGFTMLTFIVTMIILYKDLVLTEKEKKLQH